MNTKDFTSHYSVIAPLIMAKGVGNGKDTACLVAQSATIDALRRGETLTAPTDRLECACPLLRNMAIVANDTDWWNDNAERTEHLRPLIPMLLDSRGSLDLTKRRAARFSNAAIHELTPMRLEWIAANTKNAEYADKCREGIKAIKKIKPIKDKASALKARDALRDLRTSAYAYAHAYAYAYADADAYADAYEYADAYADAYEYADSYSDTNPSAYAYAHAHADSDSYADSYAYAYADSYADSYADAQKIRYRTAYLDLFKELAAMKEAA